MDTVQPQLQAISVLRAAELLLPVWSLGVLGEPDSPEALQVAPITMPLNGREYLPAFTREDRLLAMLPGHNSWVRPQLRAWKDLVSPGRWLWIDPGYDDGREVSAWLTCLAGTRTPADLVSLLRFSYEYPGGDLMHKAPGLNRILSEHGLEVGSWAAVRDGDIVGAVLVISGYRSVLRRDAFAADVGQMVPELPLLIVSFEDLAPSGVLDAALAAALRPLNP